jgi:hypothetical protein
MLIDKLVQLFLDLGCSRNMDTKFYMTLELYWHMKTMVTQGMLPRDQDYSKFKQRLEALEDQNMLLISMVFLVGQTKRGFTPAGARQYFIFWNSVTSS